MLASAAMKNGLDGFPKTVASTPAAYYKTNQTKTISVLQKALHTSALFCSSSLYFHTQHITYCFSAKICNGLLFSSNRIFLTMHAGESNFRLVTLVQDASKHLFF